MRSHLLEGAVRHRRARPFVYSLEHGVSYLALDLDELDGIERRVTADPPQPARASSSSATRTTSIRRPATFDRRSTTTSASAGEDPTGWQVTLVTNLRVLGYVFNPASFYLCRDRRGRACGSSSSRSTTRTASGTCTRSDRGRVARRSSRRWTRRSTSRRSSRCAAATPSASATRRRACGSRSTTSSRGAAAAREPGPRPASADGPDRLVRMLVRHPLVTHKTTLMIHWHALRLWLRGARFHRHREAGPMTSASQAIRPSAASSARSWSAWPGGSRLSAAERIRVGRLTVVLPDGTRRVFGDASAAPEDQAQIHIHDRAGARPAARRRRDRRRRGVHGRPVVQPGPGGPAAARRAEPRVAGAVERLVPRAGAAPPDARAPARRNTRRGAAATSPPTTTWATTSTGCSSTRR